MSGGADGYGASPVALALAAKGLDGVIDELKTLGKPGEAAVGRGFSDLALTGMQTGHAGLTSAFGTFCERWEWGVRALVQDGNQFAVRLGLSAGIYHEVDEYTKGTVKPHEFTVRAGGGDGV